MVVRSYLFVLFILISATACSKRDVAITPTSETIHSVQEVVSPTIPPTSEISATPLLEDFCAELPCAENGMVCTYEGCQCTELGCRHSVGFSFSGERPQEFIAEVVDSRQRKIVLNCFEGDTGANFPYEWEMYPMGSPEAEEIRSFSFATQMCQGEDEGFVGIHMRADGNPEQVLVACSGWNEEQFTELSVRSYCHSWHGGSGFDLIYPKSLLPDSINLSVHWEAQSKSVELQPKYEVIQPNGLLCEPTCSISTFNITLP